PSATRSATIEPRTRFMEFRLRSGCTAFTRALASKAIEPGVGGTRQRPIIRTRAEDTSVGRRIVQTVEIRLPLERNQRLLVRVARLASGHDIAARRSAAAPERNLMVHRQRAMTDATAAVIADAIGDAALPPLALAQFARFRAFAAEHCGIERRVELTHARRVPSTAPPIHA